MLSSSPLSILPSEQHRPGRVSSARSKFSQLRKKSRESASSFKGISLNHILHPLPYHLLFLLDIVRVQGGGVLWGGGIGGDVPPLENLGKVLPPLWKIEGSSPPWKPEEMSPLGKNIEYFRSIIFSIYPGLIPRICNFIQSKEGGWRAPNFRRPLPEDPPGFILSWFKDVRDQESEISEG